MIKDNKSLFIKRSEQGTAQSHSAAQMRAAADYMADMALQMRNLAKSWNHHTLQSLFEIAYYEAYHVANAVDVPPEEVARIEDLVRAAATKREH